MSPIDSPAALALIAVSVLALLWFAVAYVAYKRAGDKLDAALPDLLNPPARRVWCSVRVPEQCPEPVRGEIHGFPLCTGHLVERAS